MNSEIQFLIEQFKDAYEGDPWFGKCATKLISETSTDDAFEQPAGQHSILELVWHLCTWREFAINRIQKDNSKDLHAFEEADWRQLDHSDKSLWQQGVERLQQTQAELLKVLQAQDDALLHQNVHGRTYTYRKLIHGILQHDIYHLGQMAYILKIIKNRN
jgi:uncharacterized damage-inducible protein DinB